MIIYYAVPVFSQLLTAAAAVALLSGACKCQQKEVQNLKKKFSLFWAPLYGISVGAGTWQDFES